VPVLLVPGIIWDARYEGRDALEVAARLIARRSWASLHEANLAEAVEFVDLAEKNSRGKPERTAWRQLAQPRRGVGVMQQEQNAQLALEMALREELDRLDMVAEAAPAREQWVRADEVGRISDDLLLPERILHWIRAKRR
jgi:hypothetical protein